MESVHPCPEVANRQRTKNKADEEAAPHGSVSLVHVPSRIDRDGQSSAALLVLQRPARMDVDRAAAGDDARGDGDHNDEQRGSCERDRLLAGHPE